MHSRQTHTSRSTHTVLLSASPSAGVSVWHHPFFSSPSFIFPRTEKRDKEIVFFFRCQSGQHNYTNQQTLSSLFSLCVFLTCPVFFFFLTSSFTKFPNTQRRDKEITFFQEGAMAQTSEHTPWTLPLSSIFLVCHPQPFVCSSFSQPQAIILFASKCGDTAAQTFMSHLTKSDIKRRTSSLQCYRVMDKKHWSTRLKQKGTSKDVQTSQISSDVTGHPGNQLLGMWSVFREDYSTSEMHIFHSRCHKCKVVCFFVSPRTGNLTGTKGRHQLHSCILQWSTQFSVNLPVCQQETSINLKFITNNYI